jgi:ribosome biogenesis protein ENP2
VYSVAGAKALPAWLSEKKARAAKRDPNYSRRIELVQDLGFPGACQRLKLSPDGNFLFASGTHPPRVSMLAVRGPHMQSLVSRNRRT